MAAAEDRGQDWFYHPPHKRKETAQDTPAPSQIPGLNGMQDSEQENERDETSFRRKAVYETDSKYVQLAKRGGRRDLLVYREAPLRATKPVGYPWPEWFDHEKGHREDNEEEATVDRPPPQKPDWAVHIEHNPSMASEATGTVARAPFQWPASLQEAKVRLPALRMKKIKKSPVKPPASFHPATKQRKDQSKLPPITGAVAFDRLISMDYQKEWFEARDKQETMRRQKACAQQAHKKELTMKSVQATKISANVSDCEKKDLFKLKRFTNIPSKIDSPRKTKVVT